MKINGIKYILGIFHKPVNYRHNKKYIVIPIAEKESIMPYNEALRPVPILRREIVSERERLLPEITSQKEYEKILNKVLSYKSEDNNEAKNSYFINTEGYEDIDTDLKGLIPYCGENDKSRYINVWLSGRIDKFVKPYEDKKMADLVRVLDYSLSRADKKFGKYEGVVYRKGYFNPLTDRQYYSSAFDAESAILHLGDLIPSEKNPYSIIKLKNGHNLYEFQKYTNSATSEKFAEREKEILIDRKSKFRKIPQKEYTDKDNKLLKRLLINFVRLDTQDLSFADTLKKYKDLLKYISLWEEI